MWASFESFVQLIRVRRVVDVVFACRQTPAVVRPIPLGFIGWSNVPRALTLQIRTVVTKKTSDSGVSRAAAVNLYSPSDTTRAELFLAGEFAAVVGEATSPC